MKFATADAFDLHPIEAWNFYINRFITYSRYEPHKGYTDLLNLNKDMFVVTSNVDGHFERAGFDPEKIVEIHGDLKTMQCSKFCCRETWAMPEWDEEIHQYSEIPKCPHCAAVLRPQVMMFNDPYFYYNKVDDQLARYRAWEESKRNIVGIELGAGTSIPSIRIFGAERTQKLIRINPYDAEITRSQDISIPTTAVEGIEILFSILKEQNE